TGEPRVAAVLRVVFEIAALAAVRHLSRSLRGRLGLRGRGAQCVDEGFRERVAVAGWEECVDVAPAYLVLDGSGDGAGVVVDQQACYPSHAESTGDQAAGGDRVARDCHDAGV